MAATLPLAFYTIVTGIGECVMTELATTTAGTPDRYCPHVPGEIAWDDCECGSFTQSAGPFQWSDDARTPLQYFDSYNNCGPFYTGLEVTALVLRCAPGPGADGDGLAPTCGALSISAQGWHEDAAAVRRGVICCLKTLLDADDIEGWQVVSQTSQGPQGGCVGSQLVYRFWLPNCDCD